MVLRILRMSTAVLVDWSTAASFWRILNAGIFSVLRTRWSLLELRDRWFCQIRMGFWTFKRCFVWFSPQPMWLHRLHPFDVHTVTSVPYVSSTLPRASVSVADDHWSDLDRGHCGSTIYQHIMTHAFQRVDYSVPFDGQPDTRQRPMSAIAVGKSSLYPIDVTQPGDSEHTCRLSAVDGNPLAGSSRMPLVTVSAFCA